MNEMFYRQSALDCIANGLLKNYRNGMYLYGAPRSIPTEEIIEVEYKLTIEYVKLRKSGNVLGQTVFENCFVPVYDKENEQYTIIEVQPGTILIDEALLEEENMGKYRYTLAHELSHWILHHKIFDNSQESAAKTTTESNSKTEWQADALAASILMPKMQIKKAFFSMHGSNVNAKILKMAELFQVSGQAMKICLASHNMI